MGLSASGERGTPRIARMFGLPACPRAGKRQPKDWGEALAGILAAADSHGTTTFHAAQAQWRTRTMSLSDTGSVASRPRFGRRFHGANACRRRRAVGVEAESTWNVYACDRRGARPVVAPIGAGLEPVLFSGRQPRPVGHTCAAIYHEASRT